MEPQIRSHEESYTVQKRVVRDVDQTYTVCVPYTEMRTGCRTVMKPFFKEIEHKYTVDVPYCEKRTGMRTVCRCVPVTHTRFVCVDQGHWETRPSCAPCQPCNTCNPCGPVVAPACPTRVWVPCVVRRPETYTVNETQTCQVPYQFDVTVCRPEIRTRIERVCCPVPTKETFQYEVCLTRQENRTRTIQVCECVPEVRTRTVNETICVPRQKTETYCETICRRVAVKKICTETVWVPYCTTREIQVRVCHLVPKTIEVAVRPVCVPTCHVAACP
jgi:hypothetical protein